MKVVAGADVYGRKNERFLKFVTEHYEALGEKADVKVYDNYKELLDRKDIDAVVIAAPDHWHYHMATDALSAGKDIITGLWQGLKDNAMKPVDAIKDIGGKMIDGFKNIFGIHSPSKVMAEIGGYIDEGLAQGIEANEDRVKGSWEALGIGLVILRKSFLLSLPRGT